MELIIGLIVGSLIEWVILLFVIPIAQRMADFSMPGPIEMAWKLLVIVLLKNFVAYGVAELAGMGFVGSVVGAIVFWVGMVKVFEVDFFGAVIIMVVSWILQYYIVATLLGLVCSVSP